MSFTANTIRLDNTINGYLCSVRNADRAARSSDRRNNVVSWISEMKNTSNVAVRKKRGRRAPPSTKRLRDKKVDEEIVSDYAVDNDINDTDGQADTNQSDVHSEEHVDGRTTDSLQKTGQSGNASDGPSSASEEQGHLTNSKDVLHKGSSQTTKKVSGTLTRSRQGADEDGSHAQADVVNKGVDDESSSHKIKDDVSSLAL